MARRVFYSFHYQEDIFRVNVVRNSQEYVLEGADTVYDHSIWEEVKRKGADSLKRFIDDGLKGSTVTVVLAGHETWKRPWVVYELVRSFERGNALLTVWIDSIKSVNGKTSVRGTNPLSALYFKISEDGRTANILNDAGDGWKQYMTISTSSLPKAVRTKGEGLFSSIGSTRDWAPDGHKNFASWVEAAASAAGK